jgi:hypothetical protein
MKNLHITKKTTFLLLFLCMTATKLFSQYANTGMDFYVAFGKNDTVSTVKNIMDNRNVELILRITASKNTSVTLSFTENHDLDTTFTVAAGAIRDYKLSPDQGRAAYSGKSNSSGASATKSKKSIRVIATQPIGLLALSAANANMESTLVSPVEDWGTEYYHFGLSPYSNSPDFIQNCNGYLVIAQENNTTVQHYNPLMAAPNYPYTTVLNAGEVYHYYYGQSSYGNMSNPQGTRITADKPVAFFQNGTRQDLSGRNNFTFEQFPPTTQWGRRFILPTNEHGAIYARIYAKDVPTEITITHSNGTLTKQTIDNISVGTRYRDVQINNNNNSSSRAAWITSDKQVGVCVYHSPRNTSTDMSQPGAAWLPPIGQMTRNVLMSPLDFDGSVVYLGITHFAYIITPTTNKGNTTISLNGGAPQLVSQLPLFTSAVVYEAPNVRNSFKWVADSIGGSEYSCGIFYFGWSYADPFATKIFLNTTAIIDNPNGVIVLANGQGSYTNYFHSSGSAAHDLELTFYFDNIHSQEADHRTYCGTNHNLRSEINIPISFDNTFPRWFFNEIEDVTARGLTNWNAVLSPDTYSIRMEVKNALGIILERNSTITISDVPAIDSISSSAFCLGSDLESATPTVASNGSAITGEGWQIETGAGTGTYTNVTFPYQVSYADNGKKIRYYATNTCGTTYSNEVTVAVNECGVTVMGTVFPFVYYEPTGNPAEDQFASYMNTAFSVTAQLFEVPPVGVADPLEELLTYTPLFTVTAEPYEKAMWRPGIPKDPGMIGRTNNPGVSIHWEDLFEDPIKNVDNTELGENELPVNPVGVFTFTGVTPGNYILVLYRVGCVTRYAEVEVTNTGDYLSHRELVLGDADNDGEVTYIDVTATLADYSSLFDPFSDPVYDPRYDINADGVVDYLDAISDIGLQGFWFYNYSDTRIWLNKYFGK